MNRFSTKIDFILSTVATAVLFIVIYLLLGDQWLENRKNLGQEEMIGNINQISQDVRRKLKSENMWVQIEHNTNAYDGDSLFVGTDSEVKLTLLDGISFVFNSNSLVVLSKNSETMNLEIKYGNMMIEVPQGKTLDVLHQDQTIRLSSVPLPNIKDIKNLKSIENKANQIRIHISSQSKKALNLAVFEGQAILTGPENKKIELNRHQAILWSPEKKQFINGAQKVKPSLVFPGQNMVFGSAQSLNLHWKGGREVGTYQLEVGNSDSLISLVLKKEVTTEKFKTDILPAGEYYWRVRSLQTENQEELWSDIGHFTIIDPRMGGAQSLAVQIPSPPLPSEPQILSPNKPVQKPQNIPAPTTPVVAVPPHSVGKEEAIKKKRDFAPKIKSEKKEYLLVYNGPPLAKNGPEAEKIQWNQVGNKPVLAWENSPGRFDLEIAEDSLFQRIILSERSQPSSAYTWARPQLGEFFWRVKKAGSSQWSERGELSVKLKAPVSAAKKKFVEVLFPGEEANPRKGVPLQWSSSTPFTSTYLLELSSEIHFIKPQQYTFQQPEGTVVPLQEGPNYWRVRAISKEGRTLSEFSPMDSFESQRVIGVPMPLLIRPKNLESVVVLGTKNPTIEFHWKPIENAVEYEIQIANDLDFKNIIVNKSVPVNNFNWPITSKSGKKYWRVRVRSEGSFSEWTKPFMLYYLNK